MLYINAKFKQRQNITITTICKDRKLFLPKETAEAKWARTHNLVLNNSYLLKQFKMLQRYKIIFFL